MSSKLISLSLFFLSFALMWNSSFSPASFLKQCTAFAYSNTSTCACINNHKPWKRFLFFLPGHWVRVSLRYMAVNHHINFLKCTPTHCHLATHKPAFLDGNNEIKRNTPYQYICYHLLKVMVTALLRHYLMGGRTSIKRRPNQMHFEKHAQVKRPQSTDSQQIAKN